MNTETIQFHDGPYRIIVRQIDGGPGWQPGIHWQAEFHDPAAGVLGGLPYPCAVAWLTDYTESPIKLGLTWSLDYILVPDQLRRRGYATRLIRACQVIFPGLELTEPINAMGDGLIASLEETP